MAIHNGRWWTGRNALAAASVASAVVVGILSIIPGGPSAAQIASGLAITGTKGQAVTVTRAAAVLCQRGDGGVVYVDAGQPCTERRGLAVRPATTNIATNSTDFTSGWTGFNATVTAGADGPEGAGTAYTLTDSIGSGLHLIYQGIVGCGASSYTYTVKLKAGTLSAAGLVLGGTAQEVDLNLDGGGLGVSTDGFNYLVSANVTNASITPIGGGWYSATMTFTDATSSGFANVKLGPTPALVAAGYTGDGTGTILMSEPMITCTPDVRAYVPAPGGSSATSTADVATASNPLGNTDTSWAFSVNATPDGMRWDQGYRRGLMQIGATEGAANTASLYATDGGAVVFSVVDANGHPKTLTAATSVWAGTRTIRAANAAGTLSVSMDGRSLGGSYSGDGGGAIATQPATLYIGSLGSGVQFSGTLADICVDNTATGCPASSGVSSAVRPQPIAHTLAAIGDSITGAGPDGLYFWPAALGDILPGWTVANYGVGGDDVVLMSRRYSQTVAPLGPYKFTAVMGGINDAAYGSQNIPVFNFYKLLYDTIDASGSEALVLIESPWKNAGAWSPGAQTTYDALQVSLVSWCASTGHVCANEYVSLADAGDSQMLDSQWEYPTHDHVHLGDAGEARVAQDVYSAGSGRW